MSLYEIPVKTINGEDATLETYKGKVLLIVNTASKCGLTPQYKGLQELYEKYRDRGFVVLGFPCNQFGGQEPGSAAEIARFCETQYNVTFPMFAKIEVNGPGAHPLYQFLKAHAPNGENQEIEWNFVKFLIDRNGHVVKRIHPRTEPGELAAEIEALL